MHSVNPFIHVVSIALTEIKFLKLLPPSTAITKYHKLNGFKQQKFILQRYGCQTFETQMTTGYVLPESSWK
jgi:hypothetical protein